MAFPKGHKLGKGGSRAGAGRPTKEAAEFNQKARDVARMMVARDAGKIITRFIKRALEKDADRVLCHAVSLLIPSLSRVDGEFKVTEKTLDVAALDALRASPEGRKVSRRQAELIVRQLQAKDLGEGPELERLRRQWAAEDLAEEENDRRKNHAR